MKFEYLVFNVFVVSGPIFALLLYPKIQKLKVKSLAISLFLTLVPFVIWDVMVTKIFWYFNAAYILGIYLSHVPIEEILFFLTVPFACLVLWVNWRAISPFHRLYSRMPYVLSIFGGILIIVSLYLQWYYGASVCFAFLLCIGVDFVLKTRLFQNSTFLIYLGLVNILTFIFNLYLTARPIVTYNPLMKSNFMILTIPLEDFVYGMVLIAFTTVVYEFAAQKQRP